jgi:hypothetical protein
MMNCGLFSLDVYPILWASNEDFEGTAGKRLFSQLDGHCVRVLDLVELSINVHVREIIVFIPAELEFDGSLLLGEAPSPSKEGHFVGKVECNKLKLIVWGVLFLEIELFCKILLTIEALCRGLGVGVLKADIIWERPRVGSASHERRNI